MTSIDSWGVSQFMRSLVISILAFAALFGIANNVKVIVAASLAFKAEARSNVALAVIIVTLITTSLLTFVAFNLYANSVVYINQTFKLGERLRSECGNEFLEAETGNYQLYNQVVNSSVKTVQPIKSSLNVMQANMFLMLFGGLAMLTSQYHNLVAEKLKDSGDSVATSVKRFIPVVVGGALAVTYLSVFTVYAREQTKRFDITELVPAVATQEMARTRSLYVPPFIGLVVAAAVYKSLPSTATKYSLAHLLLGAVFVVGYAMFITFKMDMFKITGTFSAQYTPLIKRIQSNVMALRSQPLAAGELEQILRRNIKHYEEVDEGDAELISNRESALWPYLMHQNGRELESVKQTAADSNPAEGIMTSINTAIDNIRSDMRKLRTLKQVGVVSDNLMKHAATIGFIGFAVLFYCVFHYNYKNGYNIMMTIVLCISIILLLIAGPMYGWIVSVVS